MTSISTFVFFGAGASYGARADWAAKPCLGADLACYLLQWLDANQTCEDPSTHPTIHEAGCHLPLGDPRSLLATPERRDRLRQWLLRACGSDARGRIRIERELAILWRNYNRDNSANGLLTRIKLLVAQAMSCAPAHSGDSVRELVRDITLLMAYAMSCGRDCRFAEGVDRFDDYFSRAMPSVDNPAKHASLAIITLNYDVLVEDSLTRRFGSDAASYWYPGLRSKVGQPTQNGVPIFKLHGSINWFPDVDLGHVFEGQSCSENLVPWTVDANGNTDTQLEYGELPARNNLVSKLRQLDCDNSGMHRLVLGLYAPGKPAPVNSGSIKRTREACLSMIRDNPDANAVVVGVHPPEKEDDEITRDVLSKLGKLRGDKVFVNPNPEDKKRAQDFGFQIHHDHFADYIKSMPPTHSKRVPG